MTYEVFGGTLSLTQSINNSFMTVVECLVFISNRQTVVIAISSQCISDS